MALFDVFKKRKERERFEKKQKEKTEARREEAEKETKTGALTKASNFAIIKPHIAEKSTSLNEKGVYVFKIKKSANKPMVRQAIKEAYGVLPIKINIINIPSKKIFLRGRHAVKPGYKKAIVYLKEGEKINIS